MWLLQRGWEEKLMMRDGLSMRNQALIYPFTSSVEPSPPLSVIAFWSRRSTSVSRNCRPVAQYRD